MHSPTPPTPKTTTDWPIFTLSVVVDHANGGRDGAAEKRRQFWIEIGGNRREAVLGHDRVVVEGGHPARVDLAAVPQVRRGLGLDAVARPPMHHDLVALLDGLHAFAGLEHGAAALVAQQVGKELVRALGAFDLVDLRAADAAVVHLYKHLAESQAPRRLDFRQLEGRMLLHENGGFDLDGKHLPAIRNR